MKLKWDNGGETFLCCKKICYHCVFLSLKLTTHTGRGSLTSVKPFCLQSLLSGKLQTSLLPVSHPQRFSSWLYWGWGSLGRSLVVIMGSWRENQILLYISGSPCVFLRPVALESLGTLLVIHILGSHPDLLNQRLLSGGLPSGLTSLLGE